MNRHEKMAERHRFMAQLRRLSTDELRLRARFALRDSDRKLVVRELNRRGPRLD